jgi:hypothetical protein
MIDTTAIKDIKVELHRSDDDRCRCGATMAIIAEGKAMHAAALYCINCGNHRGWLSELDATKLVETVRVFGVPTEAVTIRKASPQFAQANTAASPGASTAVSSRPLGTETMPDDDFDIYSSKYLSAADLQGEEPRCRMSRIEGPVAMKQNDGTTRKRLILHFSSGVEKPLVLNQTNALRLKEWYGTKDACAGHEVELYAESTSLGKDGVRLRQVKPPAKKAAATPDPISSGPSKPAADMDDEIPFAPESR